MRRLVLLISTLLLSTSNQAQIVESVIGPIKKGHMIHTDKIPDKLPGDPGIQHQRGVSHWTDDFSNSGNWMMQNTSNPAQDWQIVSQISTTLQNQGADATLNSTSGAPFALIDSDAAGGNATQNADLIWNGTPIDLTGAPSAALNLEFENYHRMFYETHTVSVSVDGGTTWTDYEVNTQYGADVNNYQGWADLNNGEIVSVNTVGLFQNHVSGGGTLNDVSIKFNYQGAWDWFWAVDDPSFVEAPDHEQAIQNVAYHDAQVGIFGTPVEYTVIPEWYPVDIEFAGQITNNGANDEASTKIEVNVMDGATSLFTGVGVDTTLGLGGTYSDTTSTVWNASGMNQDVFDIVYRASYGDFSLDADQSNNIDTLNMWFTGTPPNSAVLGRDFNEYTGAGLWNGDDGGSPAVTNAFEMGSLFEAKVNMDLYSVDVALTASTDPGSFIFARVYQIDQTGSFNLVYDGSGTVNGEVEIVNSHISQPDSIRWLRIPIDQGGINNPVVMTAGEWYVVCVGHYGGPEAIVLMNGQNPAPPQTVFLLDGTDNTWYFMGSTPMLRINMTPYPGSVPEFSADFDLGQNVPNPTTGNTRIPYSLQTAGDVTLQVVDVTGKVVTTIDNGTQSAGNYNFFIDAQELSEGVYFYTMTVGQERVTKRMVVTK